MLLMDKMNETKEIPLKEGQTSNHKGLLCKNLLEIFKVSNDLGGGDLRETRSV